MNGETKPEVPQDKTAQISRRGFLKLSALAIGSLLAARGGRKGGILPSENSAPEFSFHKVEIPPTDAEFLASHEVSRGDTSRRIVLMTYDDFDNHDNINMILDTYKDHNFKTSFFFPGGYERKYISLGYYAKEIERIVAEGHVFGCHGLIHDPLTTYSSGQIRSDIEQWLEIVEKIIPGYKVQWMRYPYGNRNQETRDIFAEYGMQSVMWSVESGGEDAGTYDRVISRAGQGDIVLDHTPRYYDAHDAHRILDYFVANNFTAESVATGFSPGDYLLKPQIPRTYPNRTRQMRSG
jgi:peptidoglycan/xylan/chitin deacetylase (PgdA/CDA1 family)